MSVASVEWDHGVVTARGYGEGATTVLLAHGAGTNQDHPLIVGLAEALADRGIGVVTFNYPYTEAGRKAPDRLPTLLSCHRSVAAWARREFGPALVMAGRSMGGRMASVLAAEGEPTSGLVLYAYPLHPAGKPDLLRTGHLGAIAVPMLFFQGDRDALARPDLFDTHVRSLPGAAVVDLPGVDHSWRASRGTGTPLPVMVAIETAAWIGRLASGGPTRA